jgi:hypothetical protein
MICFLDESDSEDVAAMMSFRLRDTLVLPVPVGMMEGGHGGNTLRPF